MEKVLVHHGVKGQKWGVRKDVADGVATSAREASTLAGTIGKSIGKSKKQKSEMSRMTDDELRRRINRMQMEQQYANLNPSKAKRGAAKAQTILSTVGSVSAIAAAGFGIAVSIKTLMD